MPNRYQLGELARCEGEWKDEDGNYQDPTNVYFHLIDPSNNANTYQYGVDAEVVKVSTGQYYSDVPCDEVGVFLYRFYSTGANKSADEDQFEVMASAHD